MEQHKNNSSDSQEAIDSVKLVTMSDTSDEDQTLDESSTYYSINSSANNTLNDLSLESVESDATLSAALQCSISSTDDSSIPTDDNSKSPLLEKEKSSVPDSTSKFIPNGDDERLKNYHQAEVTQLPETVMHLMTPEGSQVYVVGTAHFSKESQNDVATTIRKVRPDVVMVELCSARTTVLKMDEETILRESQSIDFTMMHTIMRQQGTQGLLHLLLLSLSAHVTRELGMAPGGEFRVAFIEAHRSVPGCQFQLGDRPIRITLARALGLLSAWQKIKLAFHILSSKGPISKEEVEQCKQRDFIEEVLAKMSGEFPAISRVFVKERDIYLTKSLQVAAKPIRDPTAPNGFRPPVVVGVVGIGHTAGIAQHWGKVTDEDIKPLMIIPPANLSDRIVRTGLRFGMYGLAGFVVYKCIPRAAKSSISIWVEKGISHTSKYFKY